jgi:hypothetical protein
VAIAMALLIGMNYFSRIGQPVIAGICLGLAMIKVQDAMLFTFVLFARKQWSGIAVAVAYTLVAGWIAAWRVGTTPLHMIDQLFQGTKSWTDVHLGILEPIMAAGIIPVPLLTKIGLLTAIVAAAWLCWHYRSRSNDVLMAIASVTSFSLLYHRRFDSILLTFLMVLLAARALRRNSAQTWALLFVNGLFLWLPMREIDYFNLVTSTINGLVAIWGLAVILRDPLADLVGCEPLRSIDPLPSSAT